MTLGNENEFSKYFSINTSTSHSTLLPEALFYLNTDIQQDYEIWALAAKRGSGFMTEVSFVRNDRITSFILHKIWIVPTKLTYYTVFGDIDRHR